MSKRNYLCLQRSETGQPEKREAPSPAEIDKMYAQFNAWRETFRDNLVDLGGRLNGKGKIVTSKGDIDGPFVELKEVIGGYMVVSAESVEEAAEIARQCPGVVRPGSSVEVREIMSP
jgi:hypothetical protein